MRFKKNRLNKQTKLALGIFAISLFVYTLTLHISFSGYEGETAQAARDLLSGKYDIRRAGLGAVILYIPFILLEKIIPFVTLKFVPIFYSALTNVFVFLVINKLTQQSTKSFWIATLIATCSIVWPYSNIGMEYQSMLLLTILLYGLIKYKYDNTNPIYIGLILAYLAITKSYGSIFILPVIAFLITNGNWKNYSLWLKIVIPILIASSFYLMVNYLIYGVWSGAYSITHETQINLWWEGFYGIFFSAGKSIFIYNPLLFISLFFWPKFHREYKSTAVFLILSFVLLLLLTAPFTYWTDETWSVRKLVPILPLMHLPLIFISFKKYHLPKKLIIAIVIIASCYVQLIGSIYYLGKNLAVMREMNQDSLSSMRYIPQLSHWYINHQLLMSYLGGEKTLEYNEPSWFRWTRQEDDIKLGQGTVDLSKYNKPDIYWLDK